MNSGLDRRRFLGLLGLAIAGSAVGCGPRRASPDLPADSEIGMPQAATLPFAFHGADLAGWDVQQGQSTFAAEGHTAVAETDIATLHQGSYSEIQANIARRGIMAHNVTLKQIIDAQAVSCVQTVSFIFRLPALPSRDSLDVNGQAFRVNLHGWDDAAGLAKGSGLQWMLDPRLPMYGALATWTSEESWLQVGRLEPDTAWHIVQLAVSYPQQLAMLQIDGQPYPVQYASWRSSGSEAVIGARLQLETISLYPGPDARGAFWSVQVRDWSWSWEALTDENRI